MIPPEHKEAHEVQFIGWGEHHSTGPWIKFRLVDRESYEHFKQFSPEGKNQQRFYLVAVPIDDNEEPKPVTVTRMVQGEIEPKPKKPFHELPRTQQAGMRCSEIGFRKWLSETYPLTFGCWDSQDEHRAAEFIRLHCNVDSRRCLDEEIPAKLWDRLEARYREETQLPDQR